ncbi:TPA: uracil phosphoribosyltransferase [Campylobacter coli]|uniref:uracil phosphoribosyltransferase n=1 Tax=Campylobacter coli TaxID=195 RepID=UPI00180053EA|nr:uracil phosphoribosyltransferase [Campylobacter coli]EAH9996102.1 uracil phosphoribosyltransferase [Campylobacter coli]MCH3742876.1 uracil phosphoribosyltransferase [Campylobacter coli]MCH3750077.1 uracil phosphoribosyltransferase [Campylobacter coli]HED1008364.1 uracil phosphoribosyltransferase [Campylobacter coli]HEG8319106.1 uracil phosphoribosyltransferase [Campylobacter coli]
MKNIHHICHPLIEHKLGFLRDKETKPFHFRMLIDEISTFLLFEATKDLCLKETQIQTPVANAKVKRLDEKIMICPILRAALGMLDSIFRFIPDASVGFLGFVRNEKTLKADFYFQKLPKDAKERTAIVIDPMFATGGTAIDACNFLKDQGVKKIKFISILAAPQGLEKFAKIHSDVELYIASIDESLNEKGYIIPGLGDAGDRVFNTLD